MSTQAAPAVQPQVSIPSLAAVLADPPPAPPAPVEKTAAEKEAAVKEATVIRSAQEFGMDLFLAEAGVKREDFEKVAALPIGSDLVDEVVKFSDRKSAAEAQAAGARV